jgi:hypothetical protein
MCLNNSSTCFRNDQLYFQMGGMLDILIGMLQLVGTKSWFFTEYPFTK